ncbi:hypothetical protein V1511DRAFT_489697 [Dipodascopsis uninucleata]
MPDPPPEREDTGILAQSEATVTTDPEQRKLSVYVPGTESKSGIPNLNEDDSIYEMTASAAKSYQNLLTSKSQRLTEGRPLLTRELRQKQEMAKRMTVKSIELRIRFPDQSQLMSTFKPDETIGDVMTFVRFSLVDPMLPFYFFTTHPRKEFRDPSKELVADLAFGSREIIFFTWDMDKIEEVAGKGANAPGKALRDDVLKNAEDIAKLPTYDNTKEKEQASDSDSSGKSAQHKSSSSGRILGSGPSKLAKPPAWMRLSKK